MRKWKKIIITLVIVIYITCSVLIIIPEETNYDQELEKIQEESPQKIKEIFEDDSRPKEYTKIDEDVKIIEEN